MKFFGAGRLNAAVGTGCGCREEEGGGSNAVQRELLLRHASGCLCKNECSFFRLMFFLMHVYAEIRSLRY